MNLDLIIFFKANYINVMAELGRLDQQILW